MTATFPTASRYLRASGRCFSGFNDEHEGPWAGNWTFVILADTQFGLLKAKFELFPDQPDGFERAMSTNRVGDLFSGQAWEVERAMAVEAVRHCNWLMPKFVIVCGDMIDAMPVTGRSIDEGRDGRNEVLRQKQIDDFKSVFADLHPDISLLCVCGNHDVGNVPNRKTIQDFRREFGDDYFSFTAGGCRCLVLNTQLYNALEEGRWNDTAHRYYHATDDEKAEACELAQEQVSWLEAECRTIAQRPTFAHVFCFSHIPPFLQTPDEPKGYYNLEPHVRRSLLDQVKSAGCTKWFCGHYHQNAGGHDGTMEVVITGAAGTLIPLKPDVPPKSPEALSPTGQDFSNMQCSLEVSGLRIVTVTQKDVHHVWYTYAQLAAMQQEKVKMLEKTGFVKVIGIRPEAKGVNVMAKCVKAPMLAEGNSNFQDVVLGDETGVVTVRLQSDAEAQISACTPGASLQVQNGTVEMVNGHIRLVIDRWADLTPADPSVMFEVPTSEDVVAVESELGQ